jgi:hypothetical protein
MRVALRVIACAVVAAAAAYAYLGEVVSSFAAPAYYPTSIAANPNYLYVFCAGRFLPPYNYIYIVNAATGTRLSSYPSPFGSSTRGLGYEYGGYLWIGRSDTSYVARCNAADGSIYSSWPITAHPITGGIDCQGNPGISGTLTAILAEGSSSYIVSRHTTAGSLLSSFAASAQMGDPAWDYHNSLVWGVNVVASGGIVRGYTTSGYMVGSFVAPGYYASALAYYGDYLYLTTSSGSDDRIYKIQCQWLIPGVTPSSLGRVKAVYR